MSAEGGLRVLRANRSELHTSLHHSRDCQNYPISAPARTLNRLAFANGGWEQAAPRPPFCLKERA